MGSGERSSAEGQRRWQEEVRGYQVLGRLHRGGAEGSKPQGLRGDQRQEGRGQGPLREGQGPVRSAPVSSSLIAVSFPVMPQQGAWSCTVLFPALFGRMLTLIKKGTVHVKIVAHDDDAKKQKKKHSKKQKQKKKKKKKKKK